MENRKNYFSNASQLFGRCPGQTRPSTSPEATSNNTRNLCRPSAATSTSTVNAASGSRAKSTSNASTPGGGRQEHASSSFRFLNPPRAGWSPSSNLSVRELMPPRSGWAARSVSREGGMRPSVWETLPNRSLYGASVSYVPPAPPNSLWEASRTGATPSRRAQLPPRELISQAIRRILEEPPRRRPDAESVEEEQPSSSVRRRKKHRTAPTSGYSHRYPPGLLSDSSDEGLDTDWYPKRWEEVLGPAVANLPPTHFYRSWRTNSRGLLRYLLGEKLDEQQFVRSQEVDEDDACYDIYAPPRYVPEEYYDAESRSK